MKKLLLISLLCIFITSVNAQWTTITIPNTSTDINTVTTYLDTVIVGLNGDGIFKSLDLGNSWIDINNDLSDKFINNIQPGPWPSLFVSTTGGPFFTMDQQSYFDVTSSGLTNTDITHYYVGGDNENNDFTIGTNGGGFFYGPELDGPWTAANNGLSGDALTINSFGGYTDDDNTYYILGTNGGVYFSNDEFASWADGNVGLSGDQLHVTGVALLSNFAIISTENGAFYSLDYGMSWVTIYENIKFNQLLFYPGDDGGLNLFLFGETSYYTPDLQNWVEFSSPGEVISGATTSENLFIATTNTKDGASLYSQPISWILTSVKENISAKNSISIQQNSPNPFTKSTKVSYYIPNNQKIELDVIDMYGRIVMNLYKGNVESGNHETIINSNNLESGIYTVRIKGESATSSIKIIKQ